MRTTSRPRRSKSRIKAVTASLSHGLQAACNLPKVRSFGHEPNEGSAVDVRHLAKLAGRFARPRVSTTRRRWLSGALLVIVVGVVASGCDWSLYGYDTANTRNSPDANISASNVDSLAESWTHAFGTGSASFIYGSVTEANGIVYVSSAAVLPGDYFGGTLAAFSATACVQTPTDCTPLWEAWNQDATTTPVVANNEVYVSNGVYVVAFSTGSSGCTALVSGTSIPECDPLRVYTDNEVNPGAAGAPLVANDVLYAAGTGAIFSADGSNCPTNSNEPYEIWDPADNGGPKITLCQPIRYTYVPTGLFLGEGTPTVVAASAGPYQGRSILYLEGKSGSSLYTFAYDATGQSGCGVYGVAFCLPLWTDEASGSLPVGGVVSVANGYSYVGGVNLPGQGTLFAFDENGVNNCSSGICSPVFQTTGGPSFPEPINLAVSGNTVFSVTEEQSLVAFGATGCGQASCSGALWKTGDICAGNTTAEPPAPSVANGVAYVGIDCQSSVGGLGGGGGVAAYSASGARLGSVASADNGPVFDPPTVANGVLYFGTDNGSIYAYTP